MSSRPLLVYVPGIDGTGRLLFRQQRLQEEYDLRCLAYPQEATHTYDDLVNLAAQPLQEAGGGTVLAESFGGAIALMLTLRYPALVQRLMLVNTFAWYSRRIYIDILARVGPYLPAKPSHPALRPLRGIFFLSPEMRPEDRRRWWELTADVPMHAFGRRFGLIQNLDLRPQLSQIRTPTLVLAAPDDRVVPVSAGMSLAKRLPNATLVRRRVGHAAMAHPDIDVAALLRTWVSTQASG